MYQRTASNRYFNEVYAYRAVMQFQCILLIFINIEYVTGGWITGSFLKMLALFCNETSFESQL